MSAYVRLLETLRWNGAILYGSFYGTARLSTIKIRASSQLQAEPTLQKYGYRKSGDCQLEFCIMIVRLGKFFQEKNQLTNHHAKL